MMPTAIPAFRLPPKSWLAVPLSIPCTPMIDIVMKPTTHGIPTGIANIGTIAIAPASMIR